MVDPLLQLVIALSLSLLLLTAAQHKRSSGHRFTAQLRAYELLPEALTATVGIALPWIEMAIAVSLLVPVLRDGAEWLAAALFGLYGVAILINLLRGRRHIDCGCGGTPQPLSYWLVGRNLLLLCASLLLILPTVERSLHLLDAVAVFALTLLLVLCYATIEQLLHNQAALGGWRDYEH